MYFDSTETLGGTGTVVFGKSGSNFLGTYYPYDIRCDTLTIGPGITVRGSNGTIGDGYWCTGSTIVNQGTIAADDSGGRQQLCLRHGLQRRLAPATHVGRDRHLGGEQPGAAGGLSDVPLW